MALLTPLEGRVALVTGAARGIGLAIAQRLAADGAAVCIADLDEGPAAAAAAELEAGGGQALGLGGDVSKPADCERWCNAAAERFGDLHILVNNAGLTRDAMVHRMTDEQWDGVLDVVLRGAFNCIRAAAPWLRDKERNVPRRVVNITSVSGIYGSPGNLNYSAAKAGLIGVTRSLAREWGAFGVTVNAVAPGFIETRMTDARTDAGGAIPPEVREQIIASIPAGRAGKPADIAQAVAFFCSPQSDFITGQVLEVHGGKPDMTVTR
jgi:3-oxoacyl-[acyl-carrier protein] reductase